MTYLTVMLGPSNMIDIGALASNIFKPKYHVTAPFPSVLVQYKKPFLKRLSNKESYDNAQNTVAKKKFRTCVV